ICATNSNIPMIRRRIASLAETFGDEIEKGETKLFSFPHPSRITCIDDSNALAACKLGYRQPYILSTARDAAAQKDWAITIAAMPYEAARTQIMKFSGIGPKAADCVLLFAFQKYDAFPVDVWIRRMMRENYLTTLSQDGALSDREYNEILIFARKHFGKYCGIAQEYLYAAREGSKT
ncbi:DNA-3-methyladenine glycosylase family protein, partial [Methanoregula sp.]